MTYMKIVGLFTKLLLFLHKGIYCIVFCSTIFARFVENPYTWAKIIMLHFPSNHSMARGFFLLDKNVLSIPVKSDLCLFLACKSIGNIILSDSLPSWHGGQQSVMCRNCTDFWDYCVNVVQKVERLCLAHLSVSIDQTLGRDRTWSSHNR